MRVLGKTGWKESKEWYGECWECYGECWDCYGVESVRTLLLTLSPAQSELGTLTTLTPPTPTLTSLAKKININKLSCNKRIFIQVTISPTTTEWCLDVWKSKKEATYVKNCWENIFNLDRKGGREVGEKAFVILSISNFLLPSYCHSEDC